MILTLATQTVLIVLFLAFSFGPAFFALINTAIKYGNRTGSILATGVFLSDFFLCVLIIFLVHIGATTIIQDEKTQRFMGILAGIVLIVFGAFYFKKPTTNTHNNETIEIKIPKASFMLFKGFFLNILNPAVWLIWLGNVTAAGKILNYNAINMLLYFGITLGLVLLVELVKIRASSKLKKWLTPKLMHVVNLTTGTLLIIFGLVLIYEHYFEKL
ncbi:MAG: LysE family transporter [Bacteroidetes bacterium]|nr:LysE family transporter [Bacteroidota bacterium]